MTFLFLMDPLETVNPKKDTSYAFMVGASNRGHRVGYVPNRGIHLADGALRFDVEFVTPTPGETATFSRGETAILPAAGVDAFFVRTDPPFNQDYLTNCWLLDYAPDSMVVINDPAGIRTVNEKLWCLQFTDLVPPTLVTASAGEAAAFLDRQRKVVAKPTDGHGGHGVFIVKAEDTNAGVIFETLSDRGQRAFILQRYIQEAEAGDKRILLLDGAFLGAVLRVHSEADHRNNFFAGGREEPAALTDRDREVIAELGPYLRDLGLAFVGIDMLGDYLIEVNVTSPTCLQEMNRIDKVSLEDRVIDWVENAVNSRRNA